MARGTMHAPKPDDQRRRRNAPALGETLLQRDGEIRGPELAELTGRDDWAPHVTAWYDRWRTSPMAAAFEVTDWSRLGLLAWAVESLALAPTAALIAEIRMNEERLGATFTDRQRARMRVEDDEAATVLQLVPEPGRASLRDRMAQ